MDASQFLSRVVAPGNYIAVAYKRPDRRGMRHRFFPRDRAGEAAGFLRWCAKKDMDAWYGVSSYRVASAEADGKLTGERTQANVQATKCFWLDADIKRKGDGKADGKAFAGWKELAAWVRSFAAATGLPGPNLWVSSGYGAHLYWVLEDAVAPQDWHRYAEGFKAALIAAQAKGDLGTTSDSARILRPPETLNFKVAGSPVPTQAITQLTKSDYPNAMIYQALQPYMANLKVANYSSGGSIVGAPPTVLGQRQQASSSTAAAQANLPQRRQYLFSEISKKCGQAKRSLSTNGAGDGYPLWYLGFMSLAVFCADGAVVAHELSRGDARYSPANVDMHLQQAQREQQAKGTGAPTCAHFDAARPGVCGSCPYQGRIKSPMVLGDDDGDLPFNYRRNGGRIQRQVQTKDGAHWNDVVFGDVYAPLLDRIGEDRKLTFTYERAGLESIVAVMQSAVPVDPKTAMHFFGPQGITLYKHNADEFGGFVVAWIEKLRDERAERESTVPPFGWMVDPQNDYTGFAVGGTAYKLDGSEEAAPGGDPKIIAMFRPRGTLDAWKAACEFVIKGRPDLQVLVAAAFAAPLIEFTGHSGVVMSAWSRDSAVGKSSALQIGTTVWAEPKAMLDFNDTMNSVHYRIGQTKVMPAYWDEIKVDKDQAMYFVDTLFKLGQGRDKARLSSDSTLKESGDWKTILVATGNRPLMDYIVRERGDTDAGAVRLFEFLLEHPQMPLDTGAAAVIASAGKNAGNAGRVYAEFLGRNHDTARSVVMSMQTKLQAALGAQQPERFFVACMACLLSGAFFATALKLATFDISGMQTFLKRAFGQLRKDRAKNLPVSGGFLDVERILANFVSDHAAERLVTNHFARSGPSGNVKTIWLPRNIRGRLAIHIGRSDQEMRLDKAVWDAWCYKKGYSSSDLTYQLEMRWGAKLTRGLMGGGTDFVSGRIQYLALPLTSPDLAHYNYESDDKGSR